MSENTSQAPVVVTDQPKVEHENRPAQFMYYVKRFVKFCVQIMKKIGKENLPNDETITTVIEKMIPFEMYVHYLCQVKELYGADLDRGDVDTVGRVMALCWKAPVGELAKDMEMFTAHLKKDEADRTKFFRYWTVINQILTEQV